MPNLTISVTDDLKAEMDTLTEVNWSEICRFAISRYIAERKNPTPIIEVDLGEMRLDSFCYETGFPTLFIPLKIHNKMELPIIIDRILFKVTFIEDRDYLVIGTGCDLYKLPIGSNSFGETRSHLILFKEKIEALKDVFHSTFRCEISCVIYIEGFKNLYRQDVKTRIPIDDWKELVNKTLKTSS